MAMNESNIIGLHVGSRVFYCHRSTLANAEAGSYFERRFGSDRNFADDVAYTDSHTGTPIFFIERDGDLFAYVLKYLTRLTLNLPQYDDDNNKHIWRDLRLEAEYFSLDGLSDILSATNQFPYDEKSRANSQGILYWLGTGRGTKAHSHYTNPLKVRGRGPDNRDTSILEVSIGFLDPQTNFFQDHSDTILAWNLLQHRKKTDLNSETLEPINGSTPLWFQPNYLSQQVPLGLAAPGPPTPPTPRVLRLGSILVRPTHFSIRLPYQIVMLDDAVKVLASLVLNVSDDGVTWDTMQLTQMEPVLGAIKRKEMCAEIAAIFSAPQAPLLQSTNRLIDVAETFLRSTWRVDGPSNYYYKYFSLGNVPNLSGVGIELYGDVQAYD